MTGVKIVDLELFPEPGLGRNLMIVDEKGETRHLRFNTREQLADFHEKMVLRQWQMRMGVGAMQREQAQLYREKVEAAHRQMAGGASWEELLHMLNAENDKDSDLQEETAQNMFMVQESTTHRPDLPIFNDRMSTRDYRQLSIFRDILHTIVCAGILPYVGGTQANPEGNVLERSNLMQSLMGTQIVGHILRLASRVITLTGQITRTVARNVSSSINNFFGKGSLLGSICIQLFNGVSLLTSTAMTVGTLVVAGGNVLYQFLPNPVRDYLNKYLLKPIRTWWSGTDLSEKSGDTIITGLKNIFQTFQVSSWFGTLVGYLANPQATMLIGVTYACINLLNHFCGTPNQPDGSVAGLMRSLCTRTAEMSTNVGFGLTVVSIGISIIHSVQLILFGNYRNNMYVFQWMPNFGDVRESNSWTQMWENHVSPVVRTLSLPCLPQLEQQIYRVNLSETTFVTNTLGADAAARMGQYDRNGDGILDMQELRRFTADVRAMEGIPAEWSQLRDDYFQRLRNARGPEQRRELLRTIRSVVRDSMEHTRGTYLVRLTEGTRLHARDAPTDAGYAQFLPTFSVFGSKKKSVMDMAFENMSATSIRTRLMEDLRQLDITHELPPASGSNYDAEHIDVVLHDIVRQNGNKFSNEEGAAWLRANLPRGRNSCHLRDEWAEIIASSSGSVSRAVIVDTSEWKGEGFNYEMLKRFGKTFGYKIEEPKRWFSILPSFGASDASPDVTVVLGKNTVVTNVQRDYIGHYVEQLQQHPTADIMLFKDATRDNGISSDFYLLRNREDGIKWNPRNSIETNLQAQGQRNIDALVVSHHSDVDLSVVNPSQADQFLGKDNVTQQHDPDRISNCFCVHINAKTDYVRRHQHTIVRRAGDDTPPEGWNSFADGMQRIWGRMSWWISGSDETLLPEHSVGWASYLGRWFDKNHPYNVQSDIANTLSLDNAEQQLRTALQKRFPLHAQNEPAYQQFDAAVRRMYLDRYLTEHNYYERNGRIPELPEQLIQFVGERADVTSIRQEIRSHNAFRDSFSNIQREYTQTNWSDLENKYNNLSPYAQTRVNEDWQRASRVHQIRTDPSLERRNNLVPGTQAYLKNTKSWTELKSDLRIPDNKIL